MTRERTYRCLDCLEHTLSRPFDVSHLSVTCPVCESFQRFVNQDVYDQYLAFEEDPPDHLEWSRLGEAEKLMLSDGVVREGRDVDEFEIQAPPEEPDADAEGGTESDADPEQGVDQRGTPADGEGTGSEGPPVDTGSEGGAADAESDDGPVDAGSEETPVDPGSRGTPTDAGSNSAE